MIEAVGLVGIYLLFYCKQCKLSKTKSKTKEIPKLHKKVQNKVELCISRFLLNQEEPL